MSGKDALAPAVRIGSKWKNRLAVGAGSLVIVGAAVLVRSVWGPEHAGAQAPPVARGKAGAKGQPPAKGQAAPAAPPVEQKMKIIAVVNNQRITREDLARECLLHHGKEVLESLTNKHLIAEHCKKRNIVVTNKEIDAEIDRMADRFGLPTDQWLKMLKDERAITASQYAKDIIWPTLALRKLADSRLQVSQQDLQEAYETQFGPAVQARVIVTSDLAKAQLLREQVLKNPEDFGNVAKEHSIDANSASAKGMIQPVRRHLGDSTIEKVAFTMREGEISDIIQVQGQYLFLKCDALIAARPVPMDQVQKLLLEAIRDKKLRLAAKDVFEELQRDTVVENIFNDPQKRAAMPGVAATVNGHPITMDELAEECIERHGKDSLKGLINHRLVEQACQRRKIQITPQEMDAEVMRAAMIGAKPRKDGSPDVEAWRKYVMEEQDMSWDVYMHEVIWPEVALKKLAGDKVQVSDEDMHRGFDANYGPRVRVRAIVLNNQRRAQEVWEKARKFAPIEQLAKRPAERTAGSVWVEPPREVQAVIDEAAKLYGKLAAQYSIEVGSSALEGEVPPIQRFGGRPLLEQEAFSMRAGELSGIVQLGDKFVIIFCEGRTKPENVKFEEVKHIIAEDVRDKKMRVAIADEFAKLQDAATIDNFLANTTQSPKQDERNMFQRVNAEAPIDPTVPRSGYSGPAPSKLPTGMSPAKASPTTPLLR
jgi:parvulin-like peptidyl-prolyl isomerase